MIPSFPKNLYKLLGCLAMAMLLIACGGARSSPTPSTESIVGAIADEVPVDNSEQAPHHGDLLMLTPSAPDVLQQDIAIAVDGLAISQAEFEAGLQKFIEDHPELPDPEAAYRAQVRQGLLLLAFVRDEMAMQDEEFQYRARAELRETISALVLQRIVDSRVTVTDREVEQYYEDNRQLWVQPPRVIIELMLVTTNAEAQALIARLEAGEDFAELARVFSLHSSSQRGGRMEPFRRGTYSAALEDVAFDLRPGEVGTAETERGIFIVRKIADSSESVTPLEEVSDQIRAIIREDRTIAERAAFLAELEDRYSSGAVPAPQ